MKSNIADVRYVQIWNKMEVLEQEIASLLIQNTDLFKLLRCVENNPLSTDIDEEEILDMITERLPNGKLNPNCRVMFEPFVYTSSTEIVSDLRIYPVAINPVNIYEGELHVCADIIVHQDISKIVGGRRRNRIMSEVIKALNGAKIKLVNRLFLTDKAIVLRQFYGSYWGYSILFKSGVSGGGK